MLSNSDEIISKLKSASNVGSEIIMYNFLNKNISVTSKSKNNFVTNVDVEVEKAIIDSIKKDFPDSNFIGEELGKNENSNSQLTWIIDPIDGTNNFISGYPHFSISIAVVFKNEILFGSIFNPNNNEFFHSVKGEGSFLNGMKIHVSKTKFLADSILGTGFVMSKNSSITENLKNLNNFIKKIRSFRRSGSAALDLAYVACGRLDGFWHIDLKPWDIAAGVLLIEEANGTVTDFKGEKFDIYSKYLLSSNSLIHDQMIEEISQ